MEIYEILIWTEIIVGVFVISCIAYILDKNNKLKKQKGEIDVTPYSDHSPQDKP